LGGRKTIQSVNKSLSVIPAGSVFEHREEENQRCDLQENQRCDLWPVKMMCVHVRNVCMHVRDVQGNFEAVLLLCRLPVANFVAPSTTLTLHVVYFTIFYKISLLVCLTLANIVVIQLVLI